MVRTCTACGQKNRIPARHLADDGRCGSCKARLPAVDHPIDVGPRELDAIVAGARVPVLVDFWAAWCGPCRMAAPVVKKLAAELAGQALVLKVDTEKHPELSARYGIRGIPTFIVFRNGQIEHQQAGLVDGRQMARWLTHAAA